MTGFSKNSQKLASEYPQESHNTPQIPLIDVQIFTPHSVFLSLVAMKPLPQLAWLTQYATLHESHDFYLMQPRDFTVL